jgi:hypothetical protein
MFAAALQNLSGTPSSLRMPQYVGKQQGFQATEYLALTDT